MIFIHMSFGYSLSEYNDNSLNQIKHFSCKRAPDFKAGR